MQGEYLGEAFGEESNTETPQHVVFSEEPPLKEVTLKKEIARAHLQMLGQTFEGDKYAYLKIVVTGMKLTNIDVIPSFQYLMYVNVSDNKLTQPRLNVLSKMPHLVLIHADKNLLISAKLSPMEYLQVLILNNNRIHSCEDIYQTQLTCLELGYNNIKKVQFDIYPQNLLHLDLIHNNLTSVDGIQFSKLDSLYLAGNQIKTLNGIDRLTNLRFLHVRSNPLKKLDGFSEEMGKLKYLNIRSCKVKTMKDIEKLKVLPNLEVLIIKGCPLLEAEDGADEEDSEIRIEILARLRTLKRLNKRPVIEEERLEAAEIMANLLQNENEENEELGDDI